MRCVCSYCEMLFDVKEPFEDDSESHGMCGECEPIVFGNLDKEICESKRKEEINDYK